MKLPTMEELYKFYATTVAEDPLAVCTSTHEFNIEVAFYHGWMAALDGLNCKRDDDEYAEAVERLRDLANSEIAATIGG